MDTGSGHIYDTDKINITDIKGKLVPWQKGEEIIVKGCKFQVKEIRIFPDDEIVLKGMALDEKFKELNETSKKIDEESSHKVMDFVRKKRR